MLSLEAGHFLPPASFAASVAGAPDLGSLLLGLQAKQHQDALSACCMAPDCSSNMNYIKKTHRLLGVGGMYLITGKWKNPTDASGYHAIRYSAHHPRAGILSSGFETSL